MTTTAALPVVKYPLFELGGFDYGKQKDLRRLHQPRQRGVLHEVQTAQKRVQNKKTFHPDRLNDRGEYFEADQPREV